MHKFCHSGAKPFLQEKLGVLREIVSKTNFPDLQTQDCDICGKYFTKNTVTMMHKFRNSEAKPSLEREMSFVKNCSQNQSPR
jgi:hypothetical protein